MGCLGIVVHGFELSGTLVYHFPILAERNNLPKNRE
jgi:hypothetical protein